VKRVFHSAFIWKCTDVCKHRFRVQLLQNPLSCSSTVNIYRIILYLVRAGDDVARAVVIIIIIVAAAAVAVAGKVVAVDQEGVGGGKLLHTPALRTVGTGAGLSPEDVQKLKNGKKQLERARGIIHRNG
jgi:hypothetical protein